MINAGKSNINGNVIEKHYCADCAKKEGLTNGAMDGFGGFDEMFEEPFGGFGGFFANPFSGFGSFGGLMSNPFRALRSSVMGVPRVRILIDNDNAFGNEPSVSTNGGQAAGGADAANASNVDAEMQKKREIKMLHEQMKKAAEAEDYEKAAELRDKIRNMEKDS